MAIEAAEEKKSPEMFASLKKAGAWALQVAKDIGVKVAVDAIEKAIV